MNARIQRIAVDVIALLGLLITIGVELSDTLADGGNPKWGTIIGFAMLIGGGMWALDRVMHRLEALETSQQRTISSLESARLGWRLGELETVCEQNSSLVHVRAARDMADRLHATFVPGIIDEIEAACKKPESQISIDDVSPVHDLLAALATHLPNGGVWLGITLRERTQDWTSYDDAFRRFVTTVRDRAGRGEIQVGRIYEFSSEEARESMSEALATAQKEKINVRTIAPGGHRDISILFAPSGRSGDEPRFDNNLVDSLKIGGYRVLCAAEFDTRGDGVIRGVTLLGPEHERAEELLALYDQRWREAVPLPEQGHLRATS
ncbi:MAG TPA: hypothetical protein VF665_09990 [Longimicrobium sp.]|uniref:hypothetical protein n=1 Tax=Longimicrobium sp. TaxID=2029185 RepID=UPI002ED926B6